MAKAPRRRSGSGRGDEPRKARPTRPATGKPSKGAPRSGKPPAAKPIKPPAAKPIQPPTARPIQPPAAKPIRPPAAAPVAKPVPPVAKPTPKPVARPLGKPVGKAASARPTAKPIGKPVGKAASARPAAKPAAAAKTSRRSPAREEEVGRSRGGGRAAARSSGGIGLGAKVGLLAGLVCLVSVGIAVFLSGSKKGDANAERNAFGYQAASVLAGPGARYYRGGSSGGASATGMAHYEKTFKSLFGDEGEEKWKLWTKELTSPIPREDEGTFRAETLEKRQKRYRKAEGKIRKAGGSGKAAKAGVKARMATIWQAMDRTTRGRYSVMNGWIREASGEKKFLAGNVSAGKISLDMSGYVDEGSGFGYADGTVDEYPVRVYTSSIRGSKPADRMTAFVAVFDNGTKSGGNAIGLLMLILGPLLVGFTAFAVANGYTKNMKTLAREIDRLGSSGDPERQLRASGGEASAIARSVERMVSNLEFREKHDGADLEEVVSREQKVAEEIHGALTSRHPPRLEGYEVETLFKPGFEIGGDHFEYFRIDETHLGIILLDTNVRGIPAALVMASTKAYVRAAAPGELSPAAMLKRVNRLLAGELPAGRHVTALYVVLNTADGSATLASAGHLPLLVYRHQAGKMAKVNPEGIALGLDKGPVFESSLEEGDIPIGLGDRIVLYTDGALRTQNAEGEEFGEQRFYGAVAAEAPKNSQAFVNFVGAAIDRFHVEVPQNDDITISTVKRLR